MRENVLMARLDSEMNELLFPGRRGAHGGGGGDSRHHGRSSVSSSRGANKGAGSDYSRTALLDDDARHARWMERTAALVPPTLDPSHTVLSHRRYSVCISDLKCVLNVDGMARHFASFPVLDDGRGEGASGDTSTMMEEGGTDYLTTLSPRDGVFDSAGNCRDCALDDWIKTLSLAQNMDGQMWRPWVKGHVETEPKGWVGAFNASISLSSLFERLLNWEDGDPSPVADDALRGGAQGGGGGAGSAKVRLLSCVELTHHVLAAGLHRWQRSEMLSYRPTPPPTPGPNPKVPAYARSPASLPFSTVATAQGGSASSWESEGGFPAPTPLAMAALPLPQIAVWSFHLPLHRFAAACLREVCRRQQNDDNGIERLLQMFAVSEEDGSGEDVSRRLRSNALLFRGLMEFPTIVLSRAAQIRAGIWRRNGPGMSDQVLNYSEPPFCRPLADADILLLQFALICHKPQPTVGKDGVFVKPNKQDDGGETTMTSSVAGLSFVGMGTMRLVNLLIHRFGVFDFLGYEKSPNANVDQYKREINLGLYPPEISHADDTDDDNDESSEKEIVLPWTYSPAQDPSMCLNLVEELLHLIIVLLTELPPQSPQSKDDHAIQAKQRLKREVIHRLASGNKTHSELGEVHHVLPQRDNLVLCETGKLVNPDDASGAALEDALSEVAVRKCKSGAPDEWELRKEAWLQYDPAFHHISTRAHQSATENRPKPPPSRAYAPRPAVAHVSFKRIRRDLTADSCILAMVYRVLHVHCNESECDSDKQLRGRQMYAKEIKSETALARAVHILTLGAYTWGEDHSSFVNIAGNWRDLGGGDVGSVFQCRQGMAPPNGLDWVKAALLREPSDVMNSEWYRGKESALLLLKKIAFEGGGSGFLGGIDPSLRSGAAWLCDFASKLNPTDWSSVAGSEASSGKRQGLARTKEEELERKKKAAKEKAMARMKAQMEMFAKSALLGDRDDDDDNDDHMSEDLEGTGIRMSPRRANNESESHSTPLRNRSDSTGTEAIQAMDLSPAGDFVLTSPIASQKSPYTPHTPRTPQSSCSTPRISSQHSGIRLLHERPQCIICGTDNEPMQVDDNSQGDSERKKLDKASSEVEKTNQEKALAFCGYAQASTVVVPNSAGAGADRRSHVGVHVTLCGHAIHKSCCDVWQHDDRLSDRLEGVKKREFRCPLCQRLSNCLIPFVDVGLDWVDSPTRGGSAPGFPTLFKSEKELEPLDRQNQTILESPSNQQSLNDFLSTSKWWARNDESEIWDGQCTFSERSDNRKLSAELPIPSLPPPPRRQSFRKIQSKFGKKELISAWNAVLRTPPRLVKRRARSLSTDHGSSSSSSSAISSRLEHKESNSVTDVLRKFFDQVSDVGHRADVRRLGEEDLLNDFGEFRHYLSEKAAYNKVNREAGKDIVDWPLCISPTALPETRRQELSREKLISKLLFSIQAFTYTCCSEASEARGLLHTSPTSDAPSILSKFGISRVLLDGNLLLLPDPNPSVDDGFQPFDGRLGKLRYLGLALMVATSPVSKEVVQLCMSFPVPKPDPFDFEHDEKSLIKRAPVAYPILCGHVLTHCVGALIAVTGRARAEEGQHSIDSVVHDCRNFVQMSLIARVAQVIFSKLRESFVDNILGKEQVVSIIDQNLVQSSGVVDPKEKEWRHFALSVIQLLLSTSKKESPSPSSQGNSCASDADMLSSQLLQAVESAKVESVSFLRDLSLVCQVLVPNIFCKSASVFGFDAGSINMGEAQDNDRRVNSTTIGTLNHFLQLFQFESLSAMVKSNLLKEIIQSWYEESIGKNTRLLDFPRKFSQTTWPVMPPGMALPNDTPSNCLPLLGNFHISNTDDASSRNRIRYLPKSYTDLYAELSEMCPNIEQTGLCLVCGQVLNAAGKGECTKHAYKCGGGAGIYFLVQECVGLIMHGQKAAYVHSPYVDYYGETPQYRGRPLNLDLDRYRILRSLWSGHSVREKVIAERANTRQVIIPNFY